MIIIHNFPLLVKPILLLYLNVLLMKVKLLNNYHNPVLIIKILNYFVIKSNLLTHLKYLLQKLCLMIVYYDIFEIVEKKIQNEHLNYILILIDFLNNLLLQENK